MRLFRVGCVTLATWVASFAAGCGDGNDGENQGGTGQGGSTAGAGASQGGSGGSGAGSAGGGAGGKASGGSSGSGGGSSGSAGASGGAGRVVAVDQGSCTPICPVSMGYCALVDSGCPDGPEPCLLSAECRPWPSCEAMPDPSCGPGANTCNDIATDDCNEAGCPGFCSCALKACNPGMAFDANPEVCACVTIAMPTQSCTDIDCPLPYACEIVLETAVCVKSFMQ